MKFGYLGEAVRRGGSNRRFESQGDRAGESWGCSAGDLELSLRVEGWKFQTSGSGRVVALVRGYAFDPVHAGPRDPEAAAATILSRYLKCGELPIDRWDGSFTVILADGEAGQLILQRNVVGSGFTYYTETPYGLAFGSNLADLVRWSGRRRAVNQLALPAYFLYRFVPGRETLFADVYRLMPGERVIYGSEGIQRTQRQTIGHLRGPDWVRNDAVELVDARMAQILGDYAALHPGAVNLLSGGVDSSLIQVHWNHQCAKSGSDPESYAVHLDHPKTRMDAEYALTAAAAFGVRHHPVFADQPPATYLTETIAGTGEPPNHVQSIYFRYLARTVARAGIEAALCGEGADSLFGVGLTASIQRATRLGKKVPSRWLREMCAKLAFRCGCPWLAGDLRMVDLLEDKHHLDNPVNQVAMFTDTSSVAHCFGADATRAGSAYRRKLLEQYEIGDDLIEQTNFAGFLGEAVDSGSFWSTLFNLEGCELLCPYLDSRIIRLAVNIHPEDRFPYGKPKDLLKRALKRHSPAELVDRPKRGFGQPIFEWMAPGGALWPLVDQIGEYDFLDRGDAAAVCRKPNWFLYSLLCFDLWHKIFIEKSFPR